MQTAHACVKCGACKWVCPTYPFKEEEGSFARGRLALAEAVLEGKLEPTNEVLARWSECALCRRCEWVCPNGVDYKEVLTNARALSTDPLADGALKALKLMHGTVGRLALKAAGLLALPLPSHVRLPLPTGSSKSFPKPRPDAFSLRGKTFKPKGKPKARLLFFTGCMIDAFYTHTGKSVIKVLTRAGYELVVPKELTCCGAPHLYHGRKKLFNELKEQNLKAFSRYEFDAFLVACPTCGGALKEDYGLEKEVYSFTELVAKENLSFKGDESVTVHVPCHYYTAFKKNPEYFYEALKKVKGVKVRRAENDRSCCGFAGLFSVKNPELSEGIQRNKLEDLKKVDARVVVTECPGCVLQLKEGCSKFAKGMRAEHLADYLAKRLVK
ncbi:MAG: (Fe-S)-binding protein [Aquificae bacterium]|nr:(Fe-S)-binding protein [Aquificota bacterium]